MTAKPKQVKGRKRKKRKRRPVSARRIKSLGFKYENIVDAESELNITRSLTALIEKDVLLKKAWERGQLLRNLRLEAETSPSLPRSAKHLGFKNGTAFKDFLDGDYEARNIWNQKREELAAVQNKRIFDLAGDGKQWAIRLVEKFIEYGDEEKVSNNKTDLFHLRQKDISELFLVTRVTVNKWEKESHCPRNSDGTYNLADMIAWYKNFVESKRTALPKAPDKLRDLKARKEAIRLAEMEGMLLNKLDVIESFVVRWKAICSVFATKVYGLAEMCHGQTVESIQQVMSRFFDDLQSELIKQFNENNLLEPDEADALIKVYELIQQKTENRTQNTE